MIKKNPLVLNIIIFILFFSGFLYLSFLYLLPPVINSQYLSRKFENSLNKNLGLIISADKFKLKSYPNLTLKLSADKIYVSNNQNDKLLDAQDISIKFDVKSFKIKNLDVDYIYINESGFKNIIKSETSNKKSKFKLTYLPILNINKAEIWLGRDSNKSVFIIISDIHIINYSHNRTYCTFNAEIISDLFKNIINIGQKGYLYTSNDGLHANNLEILIGISKIVLNGRLLDRSNKADFNISGKNIPIHDFEGSFIYFLKLIKPEKQFIENFTKFSGEMDINADLRETGIYGFCIAKNLKAHTVLFDIPLFFKEVVFNFNQQSISAEAEGKIGNEDIKTSLLLTNIGTVNQEITGNINTVLTDKFADKYLPILTIIGKANTYIDYHIKNKKIDVDYKLELPVNSDLVYKNAYLGLRDKTKRLYINTEKYGDTLKLTHYDYSTIENDTIQNIVIGDAIFIKKDGHLTPEYITCRTNGYAPVSVTGSFGKYVEGGIFSGNLKYNVQNKILTGDFTVKDSEYKDFYVNEAKINASNSNMIIQADGTYNDFPFTCSLNAKNDFRTKNVHIYNMELLIDKYIIKQSQKKFSENKKIKIPKQVKEINLTVDSWKIKLNELIYKNLDIHNILLTGSIKDNIFSFQMPDINFASGTVCANGSYNINNKSSSVDFNAKNIDSNKVADIFLNLKGQISGIANATFHATTKNKLENIKGYVTFSINNGYLPKLGSTEFIIKKSKKIKRPIKFKISDIVNIDLKNMKALSSNINGSFNINDYELNNIYLTSEQKYLSLLIEGEYDIDNQDADLNLWGKYNKSAERKVKILFIPLSLITKILFKPEHTKELYIEKLKLIPQIEASEEEENTIRVKVNGNINNNNVKIELKSII